MTRPPRVPPADWSPRKSDGGQFDNADTEGLVARMLELRGVTSDQKEAFFHPELDHLHDP